MRPIAFYAPLKPPDHPVPSGDREVGRLLLAALAQAGFAPAIASRLQTLDMHGDPSVQADLRARGRHEAGCLVAQYLALPEAERPCLWFSYHVYYKAPDWIGPAVASALGIAYVVAEGSRAGKRADGPWRVGHAGAEAALDAADVIFVMNEADRDRLEHGRPPAQTLVPLPPFIDVGEDASPGALAGPMARLPHDGGAPLLLAVAMMRPGDKLASYRLLAGALARVAAHPWQLAIVGTGAARPQVEAAFRPLGERVTFHGLVEDRATLAQLYAAADLLVWPAVNEAYGMVLLEAQAHGCPVVAGAFGGVAGVVEDGATGLLTPPGDADAFAAAVATLLGDAGRRKAMGQAARHFVRGTRTKAQAAAILGAALMPLALRGHCR